MMWRAIGGTATGTAHTAAGTNEDAIRYEIIADKNGDEVLVCCVSDGAGSARHAARASFVATSAAMKELSDMVDYADEVKEDHIYAAVEDIYDALILDAVEKGEEIAEFSCTLCGCFITANRAVFFQVGDGAIVRNDDSNFYSTVFWPQNGEYQNTTSFVIDDRNLGNLNILILEERVNEVALFTDGLQMLALNMEGRSVHQPFFTDLFKFLRLADNAEKVDVLNNKLAGYLDSKPINDRTSDDKTLFLATRLA
jgi:Protein phosphatase 2C